MRIGECLVCEVGDDFEAFRDRPISIREQNELRFSISSFLFSSLNPTSESKLFDTPQFKIGLRVEASN